METVVRDLKEKIDGLCGSVQSLGQSHAVLNVELTAVKEALVKLADVNGELKAMRSESLHLLQKHDECRKGNRTEHDELFLRLRTLETKESACAQDRKSLRDLVVDIDNDLDNLQEKIQGIGSIKVTVDGLVGNQLWWSRLVIATAISAMISAGGFIWVVFFRQVSGG